MAEHRESVSRADDMLPGQQSRFFHENEVMVARWGDVADKYYNRSFSQYGGIFSDLAPASVMSLHRWEARDKAGAGVIASRRMDRRSRTSTHAYNPDLLISED